MWVWLTSLRNGFNLDFKASLLLLYFLSAFFGYLAIPATMQCPYSLSFLDFSSKFLTITALCPAYFPCKRMTAFPALRLKKS
jgi:hypothetical protein